jgi:hypothetical protein
MEATPALCDLGMALSSALPCNLAAFSARSTARLMDPEPPRRAPNLSPEPSPKEAVSVGECGNRGDLRPEPVV